MSHAIIVLLKDRSPSATAKLAAEIEHLGATDIKYLHGVGIITAEYQGDLALIRSLDNVEDARAERTMYKLQLRPPRP